MQYIFEKAVKTQFFYPSISDNMKKNTVKILKFGTPQKIAIIVIVLTMEKCDVILH